MFNVLYCAPHNVVDCDFSIFSEKKTPSLLSFFEYLYCFCCGRANMRTTVWRCICICICIRITVYCIYWRQAGHKDNSVSLAGPQTGGQLGPVSALGTVTSNFATIFGSNVKSHVFCNKNQCHFGQRVQNINLRLLQIKI